MNPTSVPQTAKVVMVVISMADCPACEDYLPRFQRIAANYAQVGIPVLYLDAEDEDSGVQAWMDGHGVEATPTTLLLRRPEAGGGVWKLDGSQPDAAIQQAFDFAYAKALGK
jgi:thiol-disulfide isomerase/thioredoxin